MLYPSLRPPTSDGRAMPHILDVILVLCLAMRAMAGWMRGAVVGVASLIGLVLGVWAGLWTSGIVEDELCPVVVARLSLPEELVELNPDPEEVEEVTWVGWQDMYGLARSMPTLLSPWAVEQMLEFGPELPVVR